MVERGFGLFADCGPMLAEAAGAPSDAQDLLTYWDERAQETLSSRSFGRKRGSRTPKGAYRSAFIDDNLDRLAHRRAGKAWVLAHPIEKQMEESLLWPAVHEAAESAKRRENPEPDLEAPSLSGTNLDINGLLGSVCAEHGYSRWKVSEDLRRDLGNLHSNIFAGYVGDLRFSIGAERITWGHAQLPQGQLHVSAAISLLADPDDHFVLGDMRSVFLEAYVYGLYRSPQSAVWGVRAMVTLLEAIAQSFEVSAP